MTTQEDALKPFLTEAPCKRCKGEGKLNYEGFTALDGTVYPARSKPCFYCKGVKTFPGVDIEKIGELIMAGKGAKRRFRASWPSKMNPWRSDDVNVRRAYYVWRLARFHGGADVTMPMTAMNVTEGDPHTKLLDVLSDHVAKMVFKTDKAAMYRWGNLLGFVKEPPPPGMPESAYEGGFVVTSGVKPSFEAEELK